MSAGNRAINVLLAMILLVGVVLMVFTATWAFGDFGKEYGKNNIALQPDRFSNNILESPDEVVKASEITGLYWEMPVRYSILNEEECGEYETYAIKRGFNAISNEVNGITFEKVESVGEEGIEITCYFIKDCYDYSVEIEPGTITKTESVCEHERGRARITEKDGRRINNAEVDLIGLEGFAESGNRKSISGFLVGICDSADVVTHEVLHTFGYEHSSLENSIMSEVIDYSGYRIGDEGCGKSQLPLSETDPDIIEDLRGIYSESGTSITGRFIELLSDARSLSLLGIIFILLAFSAVLVIWLVKNKGKKFKLEIGHDLK
jgi:hypothetical protein